MGRTPGWVATVLLAMALLAQAPDQARKREAPPEAEMLLELDLLKEANLSKERDLLRQLRLLEQFKFLERLRFLDSQIPIPSPGKEK